MKICWDMLEGFRLTTLGNLRKGNTTYIEVEACSVCGDPFLMNKCKPSTYCGNTCAKNSEEYRVGVLDRWYQKSDLTGQRFGRLKVLKLDHMTIQYHYKWKCQCDCGNTHTVSTGCLNGGSVKSCGCLNSEIAKENIKKLHKTGEESSHYDHNLKEEDRIGREHITGYGQWRQDVYKLDNYICQNCGDDEGGNLNAHHIESFRNNPELKTEVSNGITLCENCHKEFHHRYGYGNNNRAQFIEFFKNTTPLRHNKSL